MTWPVVSGFTGTPTGYGTLAALVSVNVRPAYAEKSMMMSARSPGARNVPAYQDPVWI
jgi:hypothetical protein